MRLETLISEHFKQFWILQMHYLRISKHHEHGRRQTTSVGSFHLVSLMMCAAKHGDRVGIHWGDEMYVEIADCGSPFYVACHP